MSDARIISSGPATRNRRTKVSRMPFWKPEEQEWIFLPVDRAHNQQILEEDEDGNPIGSVNLYESKGWRPLRFMADDKAAMAKLPENWRDVGMKGDKPVYAASASKAERGE